MIIMTVLELLMNIQGDNCLLYKFINHKNEQNAKRRQIYRQAFLAKAQFIRSTKRQKDFSSFTPHVSQISKRQDFP